MDNPRKLARFSLSEASGAYRLRIEDDGGGTLELSATRDQLDVIADTLDDLLLGAEDVDEVEVEE